MAKNVRNNEQKFLSQQELAARWGVSESTVFNYRDRGILPYFRVPGSTRILYPIDEIEKFEEKNSYRQEVTKKRKVAENKAEKHVISAKSDRNWRI